MPKCFYLLLLGFFPGILLSQTASSRFQSAIELQGSVSFTGLSTSLLYTIQRGDHNLYLGPKLALSDLYIWEEGPWGLNLGYRYQLSTKKRWHSLAFLDYHLLFTRPFEPLGFEAAGWNLTHELYVGYGLQLRLGEHWYLVSQIGLGGYFERLQDVRRGGTIRFSGYSSLLRLGGRYLF